jgi:enoyl-CoA hydratase/carnithine racemase
VGFTARATCAPPARDAPAGLTPGGGGTHRLVARVDVARATELVLTGDVYPAAEMHQWGVVNRILPPGGPARPGSRLRGQARRSPTVRQAWREPGPPRVPGLRPFAGCYPGSSL